jgi:methyltransferase (TIGR00027 family)
VRYVAVDFLRDDVGAALAAAGWDPRRRSLFVWEGVTNYLTEAAVSRMLDWIGTTAPGSRVVFTYIHAGVLDPTAGSAPRLAALEGSVEFDGAAQLVANVRRLGEPWTFGLHPGAVGAFVARSGLRLCEDLGADDYRRRYLGAAMPGYQFYRIAVAEVPSRAPAGPVEHVG